jgi:putative membrane protein
MMGAGWFMGWGDWLWMGVWILALVAMVWLLVRRPDAASPGDEPLEILRRRFARGELSQTDYEQAKRVLDLDKESRP